MSSSKTNDQRALRSTALVAIFSLLCAFSVFGIPEAQGPQESISFLPVVVFADEVRRLEPLSEELFVVQQWPTGAVPEESYQSLEELFREDVEYLSLKHRFPGEPVLRSQVSRGERQLTQLIDDGERLIRMNLDQRTIRARMIYPGARVDILTTIRPNIDSSHVTQTVLQNIEVVAVNGENSLAAYNGQPEERSWGGFITLRVTPEQAERFGALQYQGFLDVALRPLADEGEVSSEGKVVAHLLGLPVESVRLEQSPEAQREQEAEGRPRRRSRRRRRR